MQRELMDKLVAWKDDRDGRPMLLKGIRNCGKTYLLKEFGAKCYRDVIYVDFSENKEIADLFSQSNNPRKIIKDLSIFFEKDIRPEETLVIFDEAQFCPNAFESLKYFKDNTPEYHVAAACSYLELTMPHGLTIPIGKIELLTLFPMNFYEFLLAQSQMLAIHLKGGAFSNEPYKTFQKQLEQRYSDYLIVGGMPEVVQAWLDAKSIELVDKLQTRLIKEYESDFTRYAPIALYPKLTAIWNAIPAQLTKGNRKFMVSKVKSTWRSKDLDDALYCLIRSGLVIKVEHIEKPAMPISSHANHSHFKLYMCDVGLMRRTGQFRSSLIIGKPSEESSSRRTDYTNAITDIKKAMTENIVCCELQRIYEHDLYYWSAENPGKAEVEFVVHDGEFIIPIEVKAGSAGRARSLNQYRIRFNPEKSVLTGTDTDKEDVLPLYGFWNLKEWLKK